MKKHILLTILILVSTGLFAQNWAPINISERFCYSSDETLEVINNVLWVDSVQNGTDFQTYFLNTTVEYCDTCLNPSFYHLNQSQFLLRQINVGNNGEWLFYDNNKNYRLNILAVLGDSWVFDDLLNITATVIEIVPMEIFGINDTVKNIELSSGETVLLSKSHGIVNWRDEYQLVGIEERDEGVFIPGFNEMFSEITIGDFLYTRSYNFSGWPTYDDFEWESDTTYYRYKIVNIQRDSYSITLNVDYLKRYQYNFMYTWYPIQYSSGNMDLTFQANEFTESYPDTYGEYEVTNYAYSGTEYVITEIIDDSWKGRVKQNVVSPGGKTTFRIFEDEFLIPYWDDVKSKIIYSLAYGYPESYNYYDIPYGGGASKREVKLIGVVDDGIELGIIYPFDFFVGQEELPGNNDFLIYPSPAKESIKIQTQETGEVNYQVFNISGQIIIEGKREKSFEDLEINISELQNGIYILQCEMEQQLVQKKFVKQN